MLAQSVLQAPLLPVEPDHQALFLFFQAGVEMLLESEETVIDTGEALVDPSEAAVDLREPRVESPEALIDPGLQLAQILSGRQCVRHRGRERLGRSLGLLLTEASFPEPLRVHKRIQRQTHPFRLRPAWAASSHPRSVHTMARIVGPSRARVNDTESMAVRDKWPSEPAPAITPGSIGRGHVELRRPAAMTKPSDPTASTTLASWSATIVRALDARGLDGAAIAARAGIDAATLADADGRVPRAALTRLWQLAVEETGDPAFALEAARHTLQTTFHALGYAVLASATLREAMERIIRHRRVIGEIFRLSIEDRADCSRVLLDVSAGGGAVPDEAVDASFAVMVRQARLLHGGRDLRPRRVGLRRALPANPAPYERTFRCPVEFGQDTNYLEFSREDLDRRVPAANAELARQNDEVVVRYLARLDRGGVLGRTREALLESLPSGAPTKAAIARRLAMSPRSLQRLLADEGTSFKDLLAEARLALAKSYLEEGRLPVTEIAFVLGFADTSAFSRAFRRWTGVAPSDWARRPSR